MGNPLVDSAHKGPVLCCVNVPFVVELNKLLSKHLSIQWYEMPWCPCDIVVMHSEARRKLTFWRRHFKIHFCEDCCISNQISLTIFPKVLIDNKSALGVGGGVGMGGCAIWVNHRKLILKSCEISFIHNIHFCCSNILKLCREHDSITALLCGKFKNNLANAKYIMDSVAYRYRKSISIIERFVSIISIYIGFLATNF